MARCAAPHCSRRGFTLAEMAIVLGVIGLILGAIWVAAAAVYANMRIEKAQQQILAIVQNIRALYPLSSAFGAAAACGVNCPQEVTAELASAGVFPRDMLPAGVTVVNGNYATYPLNPWGTPVAIFSDGMTASGDSFELQVQAASFANFDINPLPDCQSLLGRMVGPGMGSGLVGVAEGIGWLGNGGLLPNPNVSQLGVSSFVGCKDAIFMFLLKG